MQFPTKPLQKFEQKCPFAFYLLLTPWGRGGWGGRGAKTLLSGELVSLLDHLHNEKGFPSVESESPLL